MVQLSVNVNKIATLRNSRGGTTPSVLEAVRVCLDAGVRGITVHPRADQRHITTQDVREVAAELAPLRRAASEPSSGPRPLAPVPRLEYNIEGDPRPDLMELVAEVRPDQFTIVPVTPGEITSQAGWSTTTPRAELERVIAAVHRLGVRVSVFVDPLADPIRWAADIGADRVELYTEPYARAFEAGVDAARQSYGEYSEAAELAHSVGLGVNAGHDLDLDNLVLFRELPHLAEVSIGHALISRAVFVSLSRVVREYLEVLGTSNGPA